MRSNASARTLGRRHTALHAAILLAVCGACGAHASPSMGQLPSAPRASAQPAKVGGAPLKPHSSALGGAPAAPQRSALKLPARGAIPAAKSIPRTRSLPALKTIAPGAQHRAKPALPSESTHAQQDPMH